MAQAVVGTNDSLEVFAIVAIVTQVVTTIYYSCDTVCIVTQHYVSVRFLLQIHFLPTSFVTLLGYYFKFVVCLFGLLYKEEVR